MDLETFRPAVESIGKSLSTIYGKLGDLSADARAFDRGVSKEFSDAGLPGSVPIFSVAGAARTARDKVRDAIQELGRAIVNLDRADAFRKKHAG